MASVDILSTSSDIFSCSLGSVFSVHVGEIHILVLSRLLLLLQKIDDIFFSEPTEKKTIIVFFTGNDHADFASRLFSFSACIAKS